MCETTDFRSWLPVRAIATEGKNQVAIAYNDLGLVTKSEQAHSGAVGMGTPSSSAPTTRPLPAACSTTAQGWSR